jgi:tetratricopeptide (TPR) repeat protein
VGATQALGHCLYSLGEYDAALAHYARVLEAAPDSAEARRGQGLSRMRLGDWEGALADLDRVIELRPDHADAHAWRASVLRELDRLDEALAAAERARELDPFEPKPWFLLGQLLGDLERDDEAEQARERFRRLDRIAQDARAEEGLILADPFDLAAHGRLVALHRSAGNGRAVHEALERLARLAPDDPRVAMLALESLGAMGDQEGARRAAQELERTGAESIDALRMLEAHYAITGEVQKRLRAGERWRRLENERGER